MNEPFDAVAADHVGFQLNSTVRGVIFNPALPGGITFSVDAPHKLTWSLKPSDNDPHGFGDGGLHYKVRCEKPASPATVSFIRSLIGGRYLPDQQTVVPLPLILGEETLISEDGTVAKGFRVPRELIPAETQQLLEEAEDILTDARDRFLSLLRWSQGAVAADKPIEYSSLYWRVDPGYYHIVPDNLSTPRSGQTMGRGFQWGGERETAMVELWAREVQEPLAHELIREAQTLVQHSPRSALLIATSAAETGIKQHLSKVAPSTAWLLENSPSPPILKMLRDYVPAINAAAGRDVGFWEALGPSMKEIQGLVEARNKLAHTGRMPTELDVQAAIRAVRDLLYILDVVEGESWAKVLVDPALANRLGWPITDRWSHPLMITMSNPRDEALRKLLAPAAGR